MNNNVRKTSVQRSRENKFFNSRTALPLGVTIFIIIICLIMFKLFSVNEYNDLGYINTSGKTIGQIAKDQGITLERLLEKYELPKNMRSDTHEAAAYYSIPTWKIAEMSGRTIEQIKKLYGWSDEITPDTPWGIAQDETLLKYMYASEKALDSFRKQYGLGKDITGDTKYKVVRDIVTNKNPDMGKLR